MDFVANGSKNVEIETSTGVYLRHAIQTHFVEIGELTDLIVSDASATRNTSSGTKLVSLRLNHFRQKLFDKMCKAPEGAILFKAFL